jgi:hypothetical protein
MSSKIKKMNSDQLYQIIREEIDELLIKIQKEYDIENFSTKSPTDKLDCQICGGCYTRNSKSKHDYSNRHKQSIRDIHDNIANSIYKN